MKLPVYACLPKERKHHCAFRGTPSRSFRLEQKICISAISTTEKFFVHKLTLSHAEFPSVCDTGGQVFAHLGVGGHEPRFSVKQLSVEFLYVRGLESSLQTQISAMSRYCQERMFQSHLVSSRLGSDKRRVTDGEEVQTREGNHVDGQFSEIGVQDTGESKGGY